MALAAFGIVDRAPLHVSQALRALNVSHSVVMRHGYRTAVTHVDMPVAEQPAWPVVVDGLRTFEKYVKARQGHLIFLVTDARAALSTTNISDVLWNDKMKKPFDAALAAALQQATTNISGWEYKKNDPSIMDYVNSATKPSWLNDLQTQLYRLKNYQQQKRVREVCIGYLAGITPKTTALRFLKANLKLQDILLLMQNPKAEELKAAVAASRLSSADIVSKATGIESFEIQYVLKSSQQIAAT
ncbi:hypothetical protein [Ralstonia phage phiRSL1]|uniref:Uncharacterized protein n=1 Tax=Ralstonia phage phiRSL1 TaxID=1980924 RepID=B2ZY31_9CAUD|nr:hypothetical protein RSL1_ORF160 [Ralstonia phage phiRSL1]BAG41607.1 hypothetical protein [Ralstonia phage phiRSL1]